MKLNDGKNLHKKIPCVRLALRYLKRHELDPRKVLDVVKRLKKERAFGYGRRLIVHLKQVMCSIPEEYMLELAHQQTVCTYKDTELPPDTRFDDALEILNSADPLDTSVNHESLGLAGAIFKRKWETTAHKEFLERSLSYYLRGYELSKNEKYGWTVDYGYTAINAAYILDLLAYQEHRIEKGERGQDVCVNNRLELASEIRTDIVSNLTRISKLTPNIPEVKSWWFLVTLAEAHFGLEQFGKSLKCYHKASRIEDTPGWEQETTIRQLAMLTKLMKLRVSELRVEIARKILRLFVANDEAADSLLRGKLGLALSGGGFRAALFHVGVLARLAEQNLLKDIEVLSCVSGGSIVGTHYYLEVRKLLQSKDDTSITRKDYIRIVKSVERQFLSGVQKNVRTRVVLNPLKNLRMAFMSRYSRTTRIGELYEQHIFSRVKDGEDKGIRYLNRLRIIPKGCSQLFNPKDSNWRRNNKVPILILNATTLNTGHNWQFTATWMGEPPAGIDSEVDSICRLRRLYYDDTDTPQKHKNIRLGEAVAASSCVPGLFEPLILADLYPKMIVRLVDGGVNDNQGTSGLLEQGCSIIIASDASGQMASDDNPSCGFLGVPLRANSIFQERLRIALFRELEARKRAHLLQGLLFLHLKKELDVVPYDWIGCKDPFPKDESQPVTSYGVNKQYQQALAEIRTDLDSFSNKEAFSLMCSGYNMTNRYIDQLGINTEQKNSESTTWRFSHLQSVLAQDPPNDWLLKRLRVGSNNAFKIWILWLPLSITALVIGVTLFLYGAYLWKYHGDYCLFSVTLSMLILLLLTLIGNQLFGDKIMRAVRYRKTIQQTVLLFGAAIVGWLIAVIHLKVFDRLFLKDGK